MPPIRARNHNECRGISLIALFAIALVASGCGSSSQEGQFASGGSQKVLKGDEIYRYEGKGKNKQKVSLSRSERRKLVFEAKKKLEGE